MADGKRRKLTYYFRETKASQQANTASGVKTQQTGIGAAVLGEIKASIRQVTKPKRAEEPSEADKRRMAAYAHRGPHIPVPSTSVGTVVITGESRHPAQAVKGDWGGGGQMSLCRGKILYPEKGCRRKILYLEKGYIRKKGIYSGPGIYFSVYGRVQI